ncbi:unnamed protein product [Ceutorhynchus assimilis]|uniref:Uncharacterized protein n=1 Tax=Ceutorhynchus assimilis TaxID=467358 RepID=A0A9N9MED1_9CUCU|nr:unnamed protein product [Ceutorhynchus assimilis]
MVTLSEGKYDIETILFVNVNAGNVWLKDLISPKGWDLGYGVVLKLNESPKGRNAPIMDRLSLDLNLGDVVGVSVGKASKSEGVELDFYVKKNVDYQEGRGSKKGGGKHMIPMIIGYKAAILISLMFGVMKILTLKAIILAKAALLISVFVLISKLKNHRPSEVIEFEQHSHPPPPYYIEKDQGFHGYGGYGSFGHAGYGRDSSAQSSNLYQAYAPSSGTTGAAAESNTAYSSLTASDSGAAVPVALARQGQNNNNIEKRRDSGFYRQMRTLNDSS